MISLTSYRTRISPEKTMVVADQLVTSGGSFLTTIILARQLGIAGFGMYSSIVLFLYLALSISNALIIAPFQVMQAGHKNLREYVSALLLMQVMCCTILLAAGFSLVAIKPSFLDNLLPYLVPALLLSATFLLHDFLRRVLLATGRPVQALAIDAVSFSLQLAWLMASSGNLSVTYALQIMYLTFLPAIALGIYFIRPVMPAIKSIRDTLRLHIAQGKWLLFTAVLQWWAGNLLVVASALFLGVKALGALRLAQTLFGVLNVLLQVFENHVLPVAARLHTESPGALKPYLWKTTRQSALLMLPVSILLVLFPRQVFMWSGGHEYVEFAFALQGMAVLYFFIFAGYASRLAIRVLLLNRDFFIGYVCSFVFSLLAARFLVMQWGIQGVIAGLIINQLLLQAYWQWILYRKNFVLWNA